MKIIVSYLKGKEKGTSRVSAIEFHFQRSSFISFIFHTQNSMYFFFFKSNMIVNSFKIFLNLFPHCLIYLHSFICYILDLYITYQCSLLICYICHSLLWILTPSLFIENCPNEIPLIKAKNFLRIRVNET